jgi:hypothetical protein
LPSIDNLHLNRKPALLLVCGYSLVQALHEMWIGLGREKNLHSSYTVTHAHLNITCRVKLKDIILEELNKILTPFFALVQHDRYNKGILL